MKKLSKIWKFEMNGLATQIIKMPVHSIIRDVQAQNEKVCIWAEFMVGHESSLVSRKFTVFVTGVEFESYPNVYLNTIQLDGGFFVGHVYEIIS